MKYQASKATKRGPLHAVAVGALSALSPGMAYRAICGVMVTIHYRRWATATESRCPRCARITAREATR